MEKGCPSLRAGADRIRPNLALSCDRDEHAATVLNTLLLQEVGMSPAIVPTIEGEVEGTVGGPLRNQRSKFSVLTVSLDLKLRRVYQENLSWAWAVNE